MGRAILSPVGVIMCRFLWAVLAFVLFLTGREIDGACADEAPRTSPVQPAAGQAEPRASSVALRRRPYTLRVVTTFAGGTGAEQALWLSPAGAEGLRRLTADTLPDGVKSSDRVAVVAWDRLGSKTVATIRTWDALSRRLGPTISAETFDPRSAGALAADLVLRQFQPGLSIDAVADNAVTLTLQAGEYPTGDPDRPQVRPGDLLQPIFRYLDRGQAVRRIDIVPFTYLVVESVDGPKVGARLITALRAPLGTNRRRGVELWAIGIRPELPGSVLRLTPRGAPDRPLAGCRVLASHNAPGAAKPEGDDAPAEPPPRRLMTDRSGRLTIPCDAEPLVWLAVLSGDLVLARVPFVPGLDANVSLELPDDSIRLLAERDIDLLKGRLVEAVARRAILVGRIRSQAKLGEWASVDKLLVELDTHPGIPEFERQLMTIRVPAVEAARSRKDRLTETRVTQLASETQALIRRYLDADRTAQLREELRELRQLDAKPAP